MEDTPLYQLLEGHEWTYTCVLRIRDDEHVRPSTVAGSDGPIKVGHALIVDINYEIGGEPQVVSVGTPTLIASVSLVIVIPQLEPPSLMPALFFLLQCCCLVDSALLPAYSQHPPAVILETVESRCLW